MPPRFWGQSEGSLRRQPSGKTTHGWFPAVDINTLTL